MIRLRTCTSFLTGCLLTGGFLTTAVEAKRPLQWELSARSTVGVWVLAYEHQPWVVAGDQKFYDYNKLGEQTSKIGVALAPQAAVSWGSYRAATEFEMGSYDFSGGGSASIKALTLEVGWLPETRRRVTGSLFVTYHWLQAEIKNVDTLYVNHTVNTVGFGFAIGSTPNRPFRWRWNGDVPLPVVITHLFNWGDLAEHQITASSEVTFGIQPHRSPLFFDVGYGFWAVDRPVDVRHHDVVNSILSFRHGLIVRAGYAR